MTRVVGANLLTHFGLESTTLATLWKITRKDSTIQGFTNHDDDIVYDGVTYLASTGFTPSEIALNSNFSVPNHDVESVLDSAVIDGDDLLAGLYDYAEVIIMLINYESVADGVVRYLHESCSASSGLLILQRINRTPGFKIWSIGDTRKKIAHITGLQLIFEKLGESNATICST